jgi:hypothetical protein
MFKETLRQSIMKSAATAFLALAIRYPILETEEFPYFNMTPQQFNPPN